MPIIAVLGGTGVQGGSVIKELTKTSSSWKPRVLTRNVNSEKAKALASSVRASIRIGCLFTYQSQGVEVVAADVNDEASLAKAFEVSSLFETTFRMTTTST